MKTITRVNIAETIYERIGLSRKYSNEILDMVVDEIRNELASGNDVKIASFGTFSLHKKNARVGRNPRTGEEAEICARTVISFKPSLNLRKVINS